MTLRNNPVVMIFIETTSIDRARHLFEDVIGLPVIENQFHPPHHHHGIFKFDAGNIILALNLAQVPEPRTGSDEGIRTTIEMRRAQDALRCAVARDLGTAVDAVTMVDRDGHRFRFIEASPGDRAACIVGIDYAGSDLARMHEFYSDRLGLAPVESLSGAWRAGRVQLAIEPGVPASDTAMRHDGYLTVVHTPDIRKTAAAFSTASIPLLGEVRFTSIGGTVRFTDPAGHQFCLYQPAAHCFDWGSGPKLAALVGRRQPSEFPA